MNSESINCTCSSNGYSTNCPEAFMQGGKLLHTIHGNDQLKPRPCVSPKEDVKESRAKALGNSSGSSSGEEEKSDRGSATIMTDMMRFEAHLTDGYSAYAGYPKYNPRENSFDQKSYPALAKYESPQANKLGRGRYEDDSSLQEENRRGLRKFESLKIGDETLTSMSIGGYSVDLPRAAQKAMEFAPLPPARLPIIFKDDDLNFHHHFFQGLEILIGRDVFLEMVSSTKYYDHGEMIMLPFIEQMIRSGYERTDTEITIFTKRVLMSTFDLEENSSPSYKSSVLIVAANLWGFQYIESGMQCKESDLKMWVSICYSHYRTIWFNTFKSAGIPHFALEGVQVRYEQPITAIEREYKTEPRVFQEFCPAMTEAGSSRRKKRTHQSRDKMTLSEILANANRIATGGKQK